MVMGVRGRSLPSRGALEILSATSWPSTTSPKMVWRLSSHGVAATVMKNWLPLVLGPELAIDNLPAFECFKDRIEFIGKSVTGTAAAVSTRASALDHELRNDAVKAEPIIKIALLFLAGGFVGEFLGAFGEADEILNRLGRFLFQ